MASIRGLRVQGAAAVPVTTLIDNSPTGRETIMGFGNWSIGTTVDIQTQLEIGGEISSITTFPVGGTHASNFAVEVNVGFRNPLIITVSANDASTDLFIKVVTAEV